METSGSSAGKVIYPVELFAFALNLIFCVSSLVNIGKVETGLFDIMFDRELIMGIVFFLVTPLMLLFIRLTNPSKNLVVQFFRLCYIQAIYILYFTESIWLSQLMFNGASLDWFFANIDYRIFGFQPAIQFPRYFQQYRIINEMFFFSYFFYYGLVATGVWILFIRKHYYIATRVLFIISVSFFIMYVWFIFFPVKGPKYFFAELHEIWYTNFRGFFFTRVMKGLFNNTNLGGAAFPSSHVALALVAFILNWKYNRYLIPIYLPLTILLFISTVYLYAHYFIDIPAGVLAGIVLYLGVPLLIKPTQRLSARVDVFMVRNLHFPAIALPGSENPRSGS
ncbi:MAG: phosphatase PAP2 family protein [Spirochaetaceae bacterium]|nr:MAG: phosphatase PAP2 family protein [Spirochaetaceae bacterium]